MKDVFINSAVSTLVAALLLGTLGVIGGFFTEPSGSVAVTGMEQLSPSVYSQTVMIQRWKPMSDPITLVVYGKVKEVRSSGARFVERPESDNKRVLEIYDIDMDKVVSVTVQYETPNGNAVFTNLRGTGMVDGFERRPLIQRIAENVLPTLIMYLLFTFVLQFLNYRHTKTIEAKAKDLKDGMAKLEKTSLEDREKRNEEIKAIKADQDNERKQNAELVASMDAEFIEVKKVLSQYRLLQAYRLQDMQRELDYWYGILKEIMVSVYGRDETATRELIGKIKERLHTKSNYGTLADPKSLKFYEKLSRSRKR